MSLREYVEKSIQKAIQKLEARITGIWKACGTENALSPKYLVAEKEVENLKAQIKEQKSARPVLELLDELDPLIQTGFSRQKSMHKFGKIRGSELHDARAIEWVRWQKEADDLKSKNPSLARNKSELAKKVKSRLNLSDSIRTIRNRIS